MKKIFLTLGGSVGAMLSGIMSFPHANLPNAFDRAILPPIEQRKATPKRRKRRPGATRKGWHNGFYGVAGPNSQEAARRKRQRAHMAQVMSHIGRAVRPRHIFGDTA